MERLSFGLCSSARRILPSRRTRDAGRDSIAVGGGGSGHAAQIDKHAQAQPKPVKTLDSADALNEPGIHHRGDRQEQKAEAG